MEKIKGVYKFCRRCKRLVPKYDSHTCKGSSSTPADIQKIYNSMQWKRLRKYTLQNYPICSRCSSVESLQVHHIYYISTHRNKAYDIDNVCVLCTQCHSDIHKKCKTGELDFKFKRYEYNYNIG